MNHLGDITRVNGSEITPVWCITGGSPCQDLSIAGKRAGLAGARSGLYMEQIRIVKEMRAHDRSIGRTGKLVRPRYMVWENVPGAYSSNGGEDFAAVLEEAVRITEPTFALPRLPDKQKWTKAGGIVGDGWSVAWRTHDAQYWGVPQRRRRISVVVDFNGFTAGDILFERLGGTERSGGHEAVQDSGRESRSEVQPYGESVCGDTPESGAAREKPAGDAENGSAYAVRIRGDCDGGDKNCLTPWDCQSKRVFSTEAKSPCLQGGVGGGVNNPTIFCLQGNGIDRADTAGCNGKGWTEDVSYTLNTIDRPAVMAFDTTQICSRENGSIPAYGRPCHTLNANAHVPCAALDMPHACDVIRDCGGISPSLQARMGPGGNQIPLVYQNCPDVAHTLRAQGNDPMREDSATYVYGDNRMVVRRLTPLECTRLQGFPDGWVCIGDWTDEKGRVHKEADAPKYKALGNSIALPFWRWMFGRMAAYLPDGATLGSLFDGIGGFPLCWESIHGKGTAIWASEIEPFAIAVTKHHFGGEKA